ncbi:protein HEG homolog 1 [Anomaloglossus baeobatrachus]|uniref:protein HEG homolog 1 n=1 Tax=Anomaloglossus baeobatrachus TaxID=238106 RepID=UPI003F506106
MSCDCNAPDFPATFVIRNSSRSQIYSTETPDTGSEASDTTAGIGHKSATQRHLNKRTPHMDTTYMSSTRVGDRTLLSITNDNRTRDITKIPSTSTSDTWNITTALSRSSVWGDGNSAERNTSVQTAASVPGRDPLQTPSYVVTTDTSTTSHHAANSTIPITRIPDTGSRPKTPGVTANNSSIDLWLSSSVLPSAATRAAASSPPRGVSLSSSSPPSTTETLHLSTTMSSTPGSPAPSTSLPPSLHTHSALGPEKTPLSSVSTSNEMSTAKYSMAVSPETPQVVTERRSNDVTTRDVTTTVTPITTGTEVMSSERTQGVTVRTHLMGTPTQTRRNASSATTSPNIPPTPSQQDATQKMSTEAGRSTLTTTDQEVSTQTPKTHPSTEAPGTKTTVSTKGKETIPYPPPRSTTYAGRYSSTTVPTPPTTTPPMNSPTRTPPRNATAGTPPRNATAGTPPRNATAGTPPRNATAGTPPRNATAGTPPRNSTAGTPPRNATAGTPPRNATAGTPPRNATAGTPPRNATAGTPPRNATAGTPPRNATAGTPPRNATAGTPPRNTNTGTPPMITASRSPPSNTATETLPRNAPTGTPPRNATSGTSPVNASTGTSSRDTATRTSPVNAATRTPPVNAPTGTSSRDIATRTPPRDVATRTPPRDTATGTYPRDAATGTFPKNTPTRTPPKNTPTGTPPKNTPTGTPPKNTPTGTPPKNTPTGTPPKNTPTGTPPKNTPTGTPPRDATTGTPLPLTPPAGASLCASGPCHNAGLCVESSDLRGFRCDCPAGWSDNLCTTDVDECLSSPCPALSTCLNSRGSFRCQCPLGYLLEKGAGCVLVRTFLGHVEIPWNFLGGADVKDSGLHQIKEDIVRILNSSFSAISGYYQSTVTSDSLAARNDFFLQNIFSLESNVTMFDLLRGLQSYAKVCEASPPPRSCQLVLHLQHRIRALSLCHVRNPGCDNDTAACADPAGVAFCQCKPGYFKYSKTDHSCRACDDGYKLEDGVCVR